MFVKDEDEVRNEYKSSKIQDQSKRICYINGLSKAMYFWKARTSPDSPLKALQPLTNLLHVCTSTLFSLIKNVIFLLFLFLLNRVSPGLDYFNKCLLRIHMES